MVVMKTKMRIF